MFNRLDPRSVTFNLIVLNVILFLVFLLVGESLYYWFGLFYPASPLFKPVQLILHMFMHGGFLHLLMNMFGLYMTGGLLEEVWGPKRFLFFYLFAGFGAVILNVAIQAWLVHNFTGSINPDLFLVNEYDQTHAIYATPMVGASGAIFGLLIGVAMLFPNRPLMIPPFFFPVNAWVFALVYVGAEMYQGIAMQQGDNIAHFAHLGGALFGFILIRIWNRNRHSLY